MLGHPRNDLCYLLAVAALFTVGCSKKSKEEQLIPSRQASAIISTQDAPGSAFIMSLSLDPLQPKFATKTKFRVTVRRSLAHPVDDAEVHASLVMPLMDMGKNEFDLRPVGNGTYEGTGEFTMDGEWEVVITAAANGKTGKATFNVKVGE